MISDPSTSDAIRAKCLATLEKHIANMPKSDIDPATVGNNQVFIQFNVNGVNYSLPQGALEKLGPMPADNLDDIFRADQEARRAVKELLPGLRK
jgi:hypothetical protein